MIESRMTPADAGRSIISNPQLPFFWIDHHFVVWMRTESGRDICVREGGRETCFSVGHIINCPSTNHEAWARRLKGDVAITMSNKEQPC